MNVTPSRLLAVGLLSAGLLAGCSANTTNPPSTPTGTPTPTASTSTPPTAAEKAKSAALATVRKAVQMTQVDLFTGDATLNDLPKVMTQPALGKQQLFSRDLLAAGWSSKAGGKVNFDVLKVLSASPAANPKTIIVRTCADSTGIDYVRSDKNGKVVERNTGVREQVDSTVVRTSRGWVVSSTTEGRKC